MVVIHTMPMTAKLEITCDRCGRKEEIKVVAKNGRINEQDLFTKSREFFSAFSKYVKRPWMECKGDTTLCPDCRKGATKMKKLYEQQYEQWMLNY